MSIKRLWEVFATVVFIVVIYSEGWKDKVKLHDVNIVTLHRGHMAKRHRSAPVPQMKCVGGSAGCSAFVPKVVECYNRGYDEHDHIQWDCKTDMDKDYKFGETVINCEGYDHPDDPYILKGSCGLEYTIDYVFDNTYHPASSHGHYSNHYPYHGNYGYQQHGNWLLPCNLSTLFIWGIIAVVVYYIYSTCYVNQNMVDNTQNASQQRTYSPPPPPPYTPLDPKYMQDQRSCYTTNSRSSPSSPNNYGGFSSGERGLAGNGFVPSRGRGRTEYYCPGYRRYGDRWYSGENSWFGGSGNSGSTDKKFSSSSYSSGSKKR